METITHIEEGYNIECKGAKGGFPHSLWATYSAFANTSGGIIYLGVEETEKGTFVSAKLDEKDIDELQEQLWSFVYDSQKVSINILSSKDVSVCVYEGYPVLKIVVKQAEREYKPVYINNNLFGGTYRRNHEGDYHCTAKEIKAMLRDSDDKSQDLLCLEELGLDVFCEDTIKSYKNRLASLHPDHVFLKSDSEKFLEQLGAIRVGKDQAYHPTRAGLLMFGYDYKIVYEYPEYYIDYQEHREEGRNIRWTERITSDLGEWSGNLYDFYNKIVLKLTSDLSIPFKMNGVTRVDETTLHVAIREALCNAISNADFYQKGGLCIHKYKDRIEFSNPGSMRIRLDQALKGGESDVRNKTILKMFNRIGVGERAGSGIPMIINTAKEYKFKTPDMIETFNPDRTEMIIYLSGKEEVRDTDEEIKDNTKSTRKKSILAYLHSNGDSKALDIAKELDIGLTTTKKDLYKLMDEGLVEGRGTVRDRTYRIKG